MDGRMDGWMMGILPPHFRRPPSRATNTAVSGAQWQAESCC